MNSSVVVRLASAADAEILAEHRVAMFRDMGSVKPELEEALRQTSAAYFAVAIPLGEYVGWIAHPVDEPSPIAGAGVQLRSLLPRPAAVGDTLLLGREGLVLNVYTAPSWRKRGVAHRLMDTILEWAAESGVVRLVLNASPAARPLYEKMSFVATREMAYSKPLATNGPWTGAA